VFHRALQIPLAFLVPSLNHQWFVLSREDKRTQVANARQNQLPPIGRNPVNSYVHKGDNIKRQNLTVLEVGDFHSITALV